MKTVGPLFGLLLAVSFAVVVSQDAPSDNLLNFASALSGFYANTKQNNITARFGPVEVAALSPSITFLTDLEVGNVPYGVKLVVVSEIGGVIRLQVYSLVDENFDPTQINPDTFDLDQLNNLELSDLTTDSDCDVLFETIKPTVFVAKWPFCNMRDNGKNPPTTVATLTCNYLKFLSPAAAAKFPNWFPVVFEPIERYDLLHYMYGGRQDFVNPCDY